MKRIISLVLTICLILTLAPVTIFAADDPGYGVDLGTPIAEYTLNKAFAESDLGKIVVKDVFNKDNSETTNDGYETTYDENGITLKRVADAGESTSNPKIAFNLAIPKTGNTVSKDNYKIGLEGIYAIDQTFTVSYPSGTVRKRTDMYLSSAEALDTNETYTTGSNNYRIFTQGGVSYYSADADAVTCTGFSNNKDYTIRTVVDSVNQKAYFYNISSDETWEFKGVGNCAGSSIKSIVYAAREYVAKDWTITFKNIKVYEIENAILTADLEKLTAESITGGNVVSENLTLPAATASGYSITWDSQSDDIISDAGVINTSTVLAEDTEVTFKVSVSDGRNTKNKDIKVTVAKTPEKPAVPAPEGSVLVAEYPLGDASFIASDLGKIIVKDLFNDDNNDATNDGYETTYSNAGITVKHVATDTASTAYRRLGFNLLVPETGDKDSLSINNYRQELKGTYVIEQTINATIPAGNVDKFTNLYFLDKPIDDSTTDQTSKLFGYSDDYYRIYSGGSLKWLNNGVGSYKSGVDFSFRTKIDTVKKEVYVYVLKDGEYKLVNETPYAYDGDAVMALSYGPRAYVSKDWEITFKNIKVYEVEKYVDLASALDEVTAESVTGNADGKFNNNLTLPGSTSKGYTLTWDSQSDDVISDAGVLASGLNRDNDIEVEFKVTVSYGNKSEFKLIKFTLVKVENDTPVNPPATDPNLGGKLLAEYSFNETFCNTELGKMVVKELNTDNTDYVVTYSADGVKVSQVVDAKSDYDDSAKLAINLLSIVDGNNGSTETYQQDYEGIYAFEITFNTNLGEGTKSGVDWRLYVCDDLNDDSVSPTSNKTFLRLFNRTTNNFYLSSSTSKFSNYTPDKDVTVRLVVDTENGLVYGYEKGSSTPKITRSDIWNLDALTSLTLVPDPRVSKDSQITLKNVKIYEIEKYINLTGALAEITEESITGNSGGKFTESLTLPSKTAKGYTLTWDSLNDDIISDAGVLADGLNRENDITVKFKVTVSYDNKSESKEVSLVIAKEGTPPPVVPEESRGKLIMDYKLNKEFAESYIGKKVIVDRFALNKAAGTAYGFTSIYTDEGITIEHTEDALFLEDENGNPTTSTFTNVDAFALNFAYLFEDDTANNTKTYQTGLTGVYDIEIAMEVDTDYDTSKSKGANPRLDFYFEDEVLLNEGAEKWDRSNCIRMYSSGKTTFNGNTTVSLGSFSNGKDYRIRLVIDTDNKTVTAYTRSGDGTYKLSGTSNYSGDIITSFWVMLRTYFEKGDKITFKNLTVYEVERSTKSGAAVAISTFYDTMLDKLTPNPNAVTESFKIPKNYEDVTSSVETSNEKIVTVKGNVKRGFTDRTATLNFSGEASGAAYNKIYTLVVKARDDLNIVPLADYDYTSKDVLANVKCVGESEATSEGLKVTNIKGIGSQAVGLLEVKKSADQYTDTFIYEHSGAYDLELSVKPNITAGIAYIELGNYNYQTGEFVPYNKVDIGTDAIIFADKYDDIKIVTEPTAGNTYDFKLRVDLDNMEFWAWVNGISASDDGFEYDSTNKILNAYRIGFENANVSDSITLLNGKLTQQVPASTPSLDETVAVADSIRVTDIVVNPDDAYGPITLVNEDGYNIVWATNNPLADLEAGKIYSTDTKEDITLTATISPVSNPYVVVKKDFKLVVLPTTDADKLLEGELAKLVPESITNQNPDALVADLLLPSASPKGYSITWKSLSTDYIDNDGKIKKNINISEPTEVTLEATMTSNGVSKSKNIKFTIAKRGANVSIALSDMTIPASGVVTFKAAVSNTNGTIYLSDDQGNDIIGIIVNNSKVSFDYKGTDGKQIPVNGAFNLEVIMNSNDRKTTVLINDNVVLDYVPYLTAANGFRHVLAYVVDILNYSVIFDEYSLFDYNMDVYGYLDVLDNIFVAKNVNLKTDAIGGVKVEWTSSDPMVLDNAGNFVAPEAICFFDVVFKMSMINGTDAIYNEKIACVGVPSEDKNVGKNAIYSTNVLEDVNNDRSKVYDNDYSTFLWGKNVSADNYITIDLGSVMDVSSLYFFQNPDENGINSGDIYVSEDASNWKKVKSVTFSDLKSNYVYFGLNKARYVKVTNITADNSNFKLRELKAYIIYAGDEKAEFDILELNLPTGYELTQASIPLLTVGPKYGSVMTWTSNNPAVISTSGVVSRPVYSTEVILTVTAECEGKTATKTYLYLVKGTATSSAPMGGGSGGGAGGGGGGGSYAGNVSGVNTGGTDISAMPTVPEIEQERVEYAPKGIFNDVKESDWYYDYLVDLKEKGIVSGYEDGNFHPNNQVTREEFLKMLISATGIELTTEAYEFADVKADDWFATYVYTAKANGIANGMDESTFGIGMPISRQDMSVMMYNIIKSEVDINNEEMFADHSSISLYAFKAVYAMKAIGILGGYETGEFRPHGNLTRAEATKVISLIMKMQ